MSPNSQNHIHFPGLSGAARYDQKSGSQETFWERTGSLFATPPPAISLLTFIQENWTVNVLPPDQDEISSGTESKPHVPSVQRAADGRRCEHHVPGRGVPQLKSLLDRVNEIFVATVFPDVAEDDSSVLRDLQMVVDPIWCTRYFALQLAVLDVPKAEGCFPAGTESRHCGDCEYLSVSNEHGISS